MLPQHTQIIGPKLVPASMVTDEAGIERVDLRGRNDLRRAARAIWTKHVHDEGRLQHRQIVGNCGAPHLAGPGEGRRLKYPATLSHQQLSKLLKGAAPLQPKELLDVLRPVRVHPFLELTLRERAGQKEGGETSVQEPMMEFGSVKV